MSKKKCKFLIPEKTYKKDFLPYAGFFEYHIRKKNVPLKLSDAQGWGVQLEVKSKQEVDGQDIKQLSVNSIIFTSTHRKENIRNLMWYIRCLPCHPDNIKTRKVNDTKCYQIRCSTKRYAMKGLVACDVWPDFIKSLTNKIIEDENN